MFYLKYRPQTIADLDNERIKATLGKTLLNDDFAHAYLLIGTRGSGKTTTARLIAKIVNCTGRKKGEEPCNKCESCIAISEARNLDVIEIDAASNTGVDDIRELREKVKLAPVSAKFKVYIIDEVHMLSTSAFNALLKTLEEPPTHVIFVLATTDPQKLPETIISRCLVYDFGKATKEELVKSLKKKVKAEKLTLSEEEISEIADKARGSFRDADKLLEQVSKGEQVFNSLKDQEFIKELTNDIVQKKAKEALERVDSFSQNGGKIKDLMYGVVSELREAMIESPKLVKLIEKLLEANALIKESPIPELPLEMVIVEYCEGGGAVKDLEKNSEKQEKPEQAEEKEKILEPKVEIKEEPKAPMAPSTGNVADITAKWPEIINGLKPHNHNLSALLRSSKPVGFNGEYLTIEAFYKFHKDKLAEDKNLRILEDVVSDIIGTRVKIKLTLKEV